MRFSSLDYRNRNYSCPCYWWELFSLIFFGWVFPQSRQFLYTHVPISTLLNPQGDPPYALASFHVLNSHMWLMENVLSSTGMDHSYHHRKFHWKVFFYSQTCLTTCQSFNATCQCFSKFTVHLDQLGILSKCRFWFRSSE